ncbi:MAG TPA: M15 family metallopeptidase [Gemmatimonadaceae bacterium]
MRALAARVMLAAILIAAACARPATTASRPAPRRYPVVPAAAATSALATSIPAPPPARWLGLLGEYSNGPLFRIVAEESGHLQLVDSALHITRLVERGDARFVTDPGGERADFERDATGHGTALLLGNARLQRDEIEPRAGTNQLRVTPVRPVEELRAEARAASPPVEAGPFKANDLVELVKLDSTIHLEIRYATTNNFLGTRFYDQARAFMQRPAAEAVVRANQALRPLGYGLLIHDAYRPWYVTKMFWDATPLDKRWLVADPAQGSRHNRGAAVDLTLYDLATGRPVEMPSTYDESTERAYADYPGGTSRQRWHRALLRRVMEAEGFKVNPTEWWHFDHESWRSYGINNVPFDQVPPTH